MKQAIVILFEIILLMQWRFFELTVISLSKHFFVLDMLFKQGLDKVVTLLEWKWIVYIIFLRHQDKFIIASN